MRYENLYGFEHSSCPRCACLRALGKLPPADKKQRSVEQRIELAKRLYAEGKTPRQIGKILGDARSPDRPIGNERVKQLLRADRQTRLWKGLPPRIRNALMEAGYESPRQVREEIEDGVLTPSNRPRGLGVHGFRVLCAWLRTAAPVVIVGYLAFATAFKGQFGSPYEDCLYAGKIGQTAAIAREEAIGFKDFELIVDRHFPSHLQAPVLALSEAVYGSSDTPFFIYRNLIHTCLQKLNG